MATTNPFFLQTAPETTIPERLPLIPQGWLRVILFIIGLLLLTTLLTVPALLYIRKTAAPDAQVQEVLELMKTRFIGLAIGIGFLSSFLTVWIFRTFIDRKSLKSLGLALSGYLQESIIGFCLGVGLVGICAMILYWSGHLQWTDLLWDGQTMIISLGFVILGALSEELIFRGYILNNLLTSFPDKWKWLALTLSAGLFATFHLANSGMTTLAFANLFLAGILLGLNYIYTGNLAFSVFLHLGWNYFQGPVLGFKVSGLSLPSFFQLETKGDLLLTGGDFGMEGSVITTSISVIAIVVLYWAFQRKYAESSMA